MKQPDSNQEARDPGQPGAKPGSSAAASTESGPDGPGRAVDRADSEAVAVYVEEIGCHFEEGGWPRMAGRMLGALIVAEPPALTAGELAERLHASRGSISTMSRLLVSSRMVERVTRRGDRRTWLRLRPDAWGGIVDNRTRQIAELRELGERGLSLFPEAGARRASLEELVDVCGYLEREWPALMERWRSDRAARKEKIA